MTLLQITEVFGTDGNDHTPSARDCRERKWCPLRNDRCNKGRLDDPLGVCTFGGEHQAGSVCPNRFLERDRVFLEIGRLAFGPDARLLVAPEMRILRTGGTRSRRIGKVDYILRRLAPDDSVTDFCALEVQAVYFSGRSIRPAFHEYLRTGILPGDSTRRLDYRSSAQKRLMPQLSLKVPVFRRWGRRFFVVVDSLFFESLPKMRGVSSLHNAEVAWAVYPIQRQDRGWRLGKVSIHCTTWDGVVSALREGQEPTPADIMGELSERRNGYRVLTTKQQEA